MTKHDTRKRIPIPKDIQPGDVLVLRDGQRRAWERWDSNGNSSCAGLSPGGHLPDGSWWGSRTRPEWDVVAIERKAKTKPKPVRDDKDAVWLMNKMAVSSDGFHIAIRSYSSDREYNKRLRAIARRLNGGKEVTP